MKLGLLGSGQMVGALPDPGYFRAGAPDNFVARSYGTPGTAVVVGATSVAMPEIKASLALTLTGYVRNSAGAPVPDAFVGGYEGYGSTAQTVVNLEPRVDGVKVAAVVMTTAPQGRLPSEG